MQEILPEIHPMPFVFQQNTKALLDTAAHLIDQQMAVRSMTRFFAFLDNPVGMPFADT